jgi:hypothetical protein
MKAPASLLVVGPSVVFKGSQGRVEQAVRGLTADHADLALVRVMGTFV